MRVEEYFADLWTRWRRGEAKPVCYEPWPASRLSACHDNVDAYVREHPDCKAIRGAWVQPIGEAEGCIFHAHSVVETSAGRRVDITPLADERQRASLAFLEHHGTGEQFEVLRTRFTQMIWPLVDMHDQATGDFGSSEGLM